MNKENFYNLEVWVLSWIFQWTWSHIFKYSNKRNIQKSKEVFRFKRYEEGIWNIRKENIKKVNQCTQLFERRYIKRVQIQQREVGNVSSIE